jgi:glyoxylase-like metal-dependent hydrolase (beta-lactamase superfamily II)
LKLHAFILCLAMGSATHAQSAHPSSASDLLHSALAAMGGEQRIRELKTLHLNMMGHRNLLEQSERPEGPYIVEYEEIDEWRDLEHGSRLQEINSRNALEESSMTVIVSAGAAAQKVGDRESPGSDELLQTANDALALGPERVLLNGISATDLKRLPDLKLQGVPHRVVQFTHAGTLVRVFLNAETHLPTAVEWVSAYPYGIFWSIWGDVTTRVYYSFWWLQNGIHYPLQLDVFRNGLPDRSASIRKIEFNPQVGPDTFAITAGVRSAFAARARITADERPLGIASRPAQEPAPGIVIVPGAWNTTIVRQQDGLVVLEAPISSGYSARLIAEAQRRFPGVPVKAIITTSDAWPHIGGVREYVARGIPVYVVARTVPLLQRFLNAPRTILPDALAKSPGKPLLRPVSDKVVIGSGPNRMEIYPLRGESSERQMMVYFPEHKLLYGSDAFQKTPDDKYFYSQTVSEVVAAVEREHLPVERFFMMHMGITPWQDALDVLRDAP